MNTKQNCADARNTTDETPIVHNETRERFGCEITIRPYKLTRQTRDMIESKLADIVSYPGAHCDFDVCDPAGEVAAVYLFLKDGKLWARGDKYTHVLRDPSNLWNFLPRSKRVRQITLITKHQ